MFRIYNETPESWSIICEKVFNYKFNFFSKLLQIFCLQWALVTVFFQVVLFITCLHKPLNLSKICSEVTLLTLNFDTLFFPYPSGYRSFNITDILKGLIFVSLSFLYCFLLFASFMYVLIFIIFFLILTSGLTWFSFLGKAFLIDLISFFVTNTDTLVL